MSLYHLPEGVDVVELSPVDNRKSFYGKCHRADYPNGKQELYSYGTLIMSRDNNGLHRHYDGWSLTTGRHIQAFCGMNKREFMALPYEER